MDQGRYVRFSGVLFFCAIFLSGLLQAGAADLPLPSIPPGSYQLNHKAMTISYNPRHKQADWVAYDLGRNQLRSCVSRGNNFRVDPLVRRGDSASLSDYRGSGFDRGHMSPAGDNRFDATAMSESFFLSNMSPQQPSFNRGIWSSLENLVRAWGLESDDGLWVATGPMLNQIDGTIGTNAVTVPHAYYKAVISKNKSGYSGIAVVMPQSARGSSTGSALNAYVTTIADLQNATGIDFFQNLNPSIQEDVETRVDAAAWNFNARFNYISCAQFTQANDWFSLGAE